MVETRLRADRAGEIERRQREKGKGDEKISECEEEELRIERKTAEEEEDGDRASTGGVTIKAMHELRGEGEIG